MPAVLGGTLSLEEPVEEDKKQMISLQQFTARVRLEKAGDHTQKADTGDIQSFEPLEEVESPKETSSGTSAEEVESPKETSSGTSAHSLPAESSEENYGDSDHHILTTDYDGISNVNVEDTDPDAVVHVEQAETKSDDDGTDKPDEQNHWKIVPSEIQQETILPGGSNVSSHTSSGDKCFSADEVIATVEI